MPEPQNLHKIIYVPNKCLGSLQINKNIYLGKLEILFTYVGIKI